jgi:hypothetical protein
VLGRALLEIGISLPAPAAGSAKTIAVVGLAATANRPRRGRSISRLPARGALSPARRAE